MIGTDQAFIPSRDQSPLEGVTVSRMIADDVKVSTDGAVTGTINYLSGVPQFDPENNDGHFFPVKFPKKNYKKLHVGGDVVDGQFVAGKEIEPSAQDPYLVIRVENCTVDQSVTVYDRESKEPLFKLNFSGANLQEKPKTISARRTRKVTKPLTED